MSLALRCIVFAFSAVTRNLKHPYPLCLWFDFSMCWMSNVRLDTTVNPTTGLVRTRDDPTIIMLRSRPLCFPLGQPFIPAAVTTSVLLNHGTNRGSHIASVAKLLFWMQVPSQSSRSHATMKRVCLDALVLYRKAKLGDSVKVLKEGLA